MKAYIPHAKRGIAMIGGNIANFVFTLARNKLLAIYLGPTGIGLIALINNLNETGAAASGTGICDAYNRELARSRTGFTDKEIVSSGIGIFLVLLSLVLPMIFGLYFFVVQSDSSSIIVIVGLTIAGASAGIWRLLSGIYLGFGLSRAMFQAVVIGAIANLAAAGLLLWLGIREPIAFVATTPVLLVIIGLISLAGQIKGMIIWEAIRKMPARKPIMAIALPIMLGLLLEPLTTFYLRSVAAAKFGEIALGIIQPGLQLGMLVSALWNAFLGMTIVRWDQSREKPFSSKFVMLAFTSIAIPLIGAAIAFGMVPLWATVVSVLFTTEFIPGVITIPWFLAGEACRMSGIMLNHTFLSRDMGMITVIPRIFCLLFTVIAINIGFSSNILQISQVYAMAYASYLAITFSLWLWLQFRLQRVAQKSYIS